MSWSLVLEAILGSLGTNYSLETLLLDNCLQGNNSSVVQAFSSLRANSSLKELSLEANEMTDETFARICEAFSPGLGSIAKLDLRYNYLGNDSARIIASLLEEDVSGLKHVNLDSNEIEDEGLVSICRALKKNKTLTAIGLSSNGITNDGSIALADVLKVNSTLTWLLIDSHDGVQDGLIAVANALKENETLKSLVFSSTLPGENVLSAIRETLRDNLVLAEIHVFRGSVGSRDPDIDYYLKLNRAGRSKVIDRHDATESDWMEVLEDSDGDVDCLYYFLRANPALCEHVGDKESGSMSRRPRKKQRRSRR